MAKENEKAQKVQEVTTLPQHDLSLLEDYTLKCIVTNVEQLSDNGRIRIVITTNSQFKTINGTTEEHELTNRFSVDPLNIHQALSNSGNPYIDVVNSYLLGDNIPSHIMAMVLKGATIEAKRIYKKKGEKREHGEDVYTNNLYKTEFVNIVYKEMHPIIEKALVKAIEKIEEIANEKQTARENKKEELKSQINQLIRGW